MEKSSDIVPTIQNLISDSKKYAEMKAATIGMTIPNSTKNIIEEITALLPNQNGNELAESKAA